jgi:hypothetical protein
MREREQSVTLRVDHATALHWIAEEASAPESIWERLIEACRAECPSMNARDWEMEGEVEGTELVVRFWRER